MVLVLGGGYLGGRIARPKTVDEPDATAQPVGEPVSYDLD